METMPSSALLQGVRVWLSGAVPKGATEEQRKSLLTFVAEFAAIVFKSGGHILHGSHPSFVPTLLRVAKAHVDRGGRKDCLTLAVSRFWSKAPDAVPLAEWREICSVYETPEDTSAEGALDKSLNILRSWMSERCDAFVAAGGVWWDEIPGRAGVPLEAGLAFERGVPCFLLGGLGGAARDFVVNHPTVIDRLKNGLDANSNQLLALETNLSGIVSTVHSQLVRLPLVRGRVVDESHSEF